MISFQYLDSPIGKLLVAGDEQGIRYIHLPQNGKPQQPEADWKEDAGPLREALKQLKEYFAGSRKQFTVKLYLEVPPFQARVLEKLREVPYGETVSYGELARRAGNPKASRAVGRANATNPVPIIIPCHRVIGSSGKLVGFGGGLEMKQALLDLESRGK